MIRPLLKKVVFQALQVLVKIRLRRLRPFIIGVTGSVGKTSTKDAIYTILKTRFRVLRNEKSYNTEFGLPLAIFGENSGFTSFAEWAGILLRCVWKAFIAPRDAEMMVLEMGVDKPGDMDVLLHMVQPQIGVFTAVKPVHLGAGQFKDCDDILLEKGKLAYRLPPTGIAIINGDDPFFLTLTDKLQCQKVLFGTHESANVRALKVVSSRTGIQGTIVARMPGSQQEEVATFDVALPGIFQIYVILPALAVALTKGFKLEEAVAALRDFQLPPGRMNFLEGIRGSTIIDSSYNSSPEAAREALDVLKEFSGVRRIAVLGSMNELGEEAERYHRMVGGYSVGRADMLVTVGEDARWIREEALAKGFDPKMVSHYGNATDAAKALKPILQKDDMILVKGSQNRVRLEKLVRVLVPESLRAAEMLVRQEDPWQRR